jgi:hypothetical protein
MSSAKFPFVILILLFSIYSCSIQKRYHRKGFTITWNKSKTSSKKHGISTVILNEKKLAKPKKNCIVQESKNSFQPNSNTEKQIIDNQFNSIYQTKNMKNVQSLNDNAGTNTLTSQKMKRQNKNSQSSVHFRNSFEKNIAKIREPNDFDSANNFLYIAGVFLVIALVIAGLGLLFSIEIMSLIASICLIICGVFFLLFLFEGFLTLITFGML